MQIAIAKIGNAGLLVTPDGKPALHKDSETPTHLKVNFKSTPPQ